MSFNKDIEYKSLDEDDELPTYNQIGNLDVEDTSSYYNEIENIFYSLPPGNNTFINKTYKEIVEIDDLLTIVLADVRNPPSFILNNFSFIDYGFHKRLMKYTPKNCNPVSTKIIFNSGASTSASKIGIQAPPGYPKIYSTPCFFSTSTTI